MVYTCRAVELEEQQVVEILMLNGANALQISTVGTMTSTALHKAIEQGNFNIVSSICKQYQGITQPSNRPNLQADCCGVTPLLR